MEAKGEYQKMLELERKRAADLEAKLNAEEERRRGAIKLSAVLKALDAEVDEKYWGHLGIDSVAIDPATGEVDANSVAQAVETVKKGFPEILKRKNGPRFPIDAPKGQMGDKINESDWKKLGPKEMKEYKHHQIIWGS